MRFASKRHAVDVESEVQLAEPRARFPRPLRELDVVRERQWKRSHSTFGASARWSRCLHRWPKHQWGTGCEWTEIGRLARSRLHCVGQRQACKMLELASNHGEKRAGQAGRSDMPSRRCILRRRHFVALNCDNFGLWAAGCNTLSEARTCGGDGSFYFDPPPALHYLPPAAPTASSMCSGPQYAHHIRPAPGADPLALARCPVKRSVVRYTPTHSTGYSRRNGWTACTPEAWGTYSRRSSTHVARSPTLASAWLAPL